MKTLKITSIPLLLLAACAVGPDYKRPEVETPAAYREAGNWQAAAPRDTAERGKWWVIFGDASLDSLMAQIDISNQTLAAAEAQVRISAALAEQSRAAWWPTVNSQVSRTESKPSQTTGPIVGTATSKRIINSLSVSATWEADLWGRIRRLVEAGDATTRAKIGRAHV